VNSKAVNLMEETSEKTKASVELKKTTLIHQPGEKAMETVKWV
jgi:hypothetical protein